MTGYVNAFLILAQETAGNQSNNGSVIFVAIVGGLSAVVGAYFAYKGQKKQSDTTETVATTGTVLEERKQIAEEWRTLREYKDLQLTAARKENDALHAQLRLIESTLEDRDTLIRRMIETLDRTGLSSIVPKEARDLK